MLWVFVTHFCYHFEVWNFCQVFVEMYFWFLYLKYCVTLERVVIWIILIYLNWQNCFLYGSKDWVLRVLLVSDFGRSVPYVYLKFCFLQTQTIFHPALLHVSGYKIWFCNDWLQSVFRFCQGKFETTARYWLDTWIIFNLLLHQGINV